MPLPRSTQAPADDGPSAAQARGAPYTPRGAPYAPRGALCIAPKMLPSVSLK